MLTSDGLSILYRFVLFTCPSFKCFQSVSCDDGMVRRQDLKKLTLNFAQKQPVVRFSEDDSERVVWPENVA